MDLLLSFLTSEFIGKPLWVWLTFVGIVVTLLAFDLGVLHKDDHEIGVRESLLLSAGYISVDLHRILTQGGCGQKLGLPGGSSCTRTKTAFERFGFT